MCVCLRGAVKGKAEERMTLNPWPSVVSLCTTSQDRSCGGLSVPQFPGGGIKKCRRLVASLGTTVGKPVPQGISWAKRPEEFYLLSELENGLTCKTKCRMNRATF